MSVERFNRRMRIAAAVLADADKMASSTDTDLTDLIVDTTIYPIPITASEWRAFRDMPERRTRIDRDLYQRWQAAHAMKSYALSDLLRKQLLAAGVVVHVKKDGGYGWTPLRQ